MLGKSTKGIYWVLAECTDPSRDAEFNEWYDNTHLPDIIGTGLFARAIRYVAETAETPRYLTIYEIETGELGDVLPTLAKHRQKWQDAGRMFPALEVVRRGLMKTREPGMFTLGDTSKQIKGVLMMGSNIKTPGTEAIYNYWYDNFHMKDLSATGMFSVSHRVEAVDPQPGEPRYVNFYEATIDDISSIPKVLDQHRPGWIERGTFYGDREFVVRGSYRLLTTYPKAGQ